MVTYYCCGCRAQYAAQPRRCDRCKGKAFAAIDDNAPTRAMLDAAEPSPVAPEDLDAELREAFRSSERHRLTSLGLVVPASLVLDDAPPTPRDPPEQR